MNPFTKTALAFMNEVRGKISTFAETKNHDAAYVALQVLELNVKNLCQTLTETPLLESSERIDIAQCILELQKLRSDIASTVMNSITVRERGVRHTSRR